MSIDLRRDAAQRIGQSGRIALGDAIRKHLASHSGATSTDVARALGVNPKLVRAIRAHWEQRA